MENEKRNPDSKLKLNLKKDTIRELGVPELSQVVGGGSASCCLNSCDTDWASGGSGSHCTPCLCC